MAKRAEKSALFQSISPLGSKLSHVLSPQMLNSWERSLARCREMNDMAFALPERMERLEVRIGKSRECTRTYVGDAAYLH